MITNMLKVAIKEKKETIDNPNKLIRKKTDLKTADIYSYFVKHKLGRDLNKQQFLDILRQYNTIIFDKVIDGDRVNLYPSLGDLMVIEATRKDFIVHSETGDILPNKRGIDWGLTRKLNLRNEEGKLIRQFFTSSKQESYYKVYWLRTFGNATNISLYKFIPNRMTKKDLPEKIKSDNTIHFKYRNNSNYCRNLKKS